MLQKGVPYEGAFCQGRSASSEWEGRGGRGKEEWLEKLISATIPLGRSGQPSEMTSVLLFLASEDATYITGATILSDGGHTVSVPQLNLGGTIGQNGMTSDRPADKCAVCNDVSNAYTYGLFLCRACLAFFKRSNGRMHICRRQNNCDIAQDGLRTSCRACRLRKCYEVGMTVDDGEQALTNIATNLSQTLSVSPSMTSTVSPTAVAEQRRGPWAVPSNSSVTFRRERANDNASCMNGDA
ncbi:estrogen receptor-like protein [Aphelenchoides avenae]|nr:estrogen receptor-like protein [Aphelenchus avenae]